LHWRCRKKPRQLQFGQHLRALREGRGLTRAELARRAGVPVSTLRNWEGDRGFPSLPAILRIAEVLGVSVERIAEGVTDPVEEELETPPEKPRQRRKGKAP
jgi:transcriptional regulator with XRE-family HTH domain